MVRRRRFLSAAGTAVLGTTLIGGVPAAGSGAGGPSSGGNRSKDALREDLTVKYSRSSSRFTFEYEYPVPSAVNGLTIDLDLFDVLEVTVAETANLDRDEDDEGRFFWDGGDDPRILLERDVKDNDYADRPYGWRDGDEALTIAVNTTVWIRDDGAGVDLERSRTFDGEGHAGGSIVYAGGHQLETREAAGTQVRVLVADSVDRRPDVEPILDLYAHGETHLDSRRSHDHVAAFVVPSERLDKDGTTTLSTALLAPDGATVDGVSNIPAHEYAHVLFGVFGGGETYWLKEGAAEYYGSLLSLDAGHASVDEFLDAVRTDEHADAVLADEDAVRSSGADYAKGGHVLAALDAEIQDRSDGTNTLLDALAADDYRLSTYAGFEDAVVDAAGDEGMRDWLDRYVRSSDIPEVPADESYYRLDRRPTTTPSPTPSPTPTRTAPATATRTSTSSDAASPTPGTEATESPARSGETGTSGSPTATGAPGFSFASAVGGGLLAYLLASNGRDG